jgi:hypothetical protein
MLDDPSGGPGSTAKATNLGLDQVEYDGITYKICMAELSYDIPYIGILL